MQVDHVLVKEYENKQFKGPSSLSYNKEDHLLFIADSGNFNNGNLFPKDSTIFIVDLDSKVIRPIIQNLSYVSDILYDSTKRVLYVAEMFMNRILRFCQYPHGVYQCSVFYQFSGRVGPSALAIDDMGNLYVARYEFAQSDLDNEVDGMISVLNPNGILVGELIIPKLPEITGLYISTKIKENLYFTEKNSTGILKTKLSTFTSELDKLDESYKFN